MEKIVHGGDRYRNKIKMDFSININPLGIPKSVKEVLLSAVEQAECYPDLYAQKLYEGLANRFSLDVSNVVCGNGASELLMAVIHAWEPQKIVLPVPSFRGYQHVTEAKDAQIVLYEMKEKNGFSLDEGFLPVLKEDIDMLFLTNPNNPTGKYIEHELLEEILERCKEFDILVILDECFMELSDEPEKNSCVTKLKKWNNVLILRAFTKSFAIPGIRLGYLLGADEKKIERMKRHLPEWNLSIAAQEAGYVALKEEDYIEKSRKYIETERQYLMGELKKINIDTLPSVTNFMLIRQPKNQPQINLYQKLLKKGILIRDCSDYQGLDSGYYRIAVKTHGENEKIIEQLTKILTEKK